LRLAVAASSLGLALLLAEGLARVRVAIAHGAPVDPMIDLQSDLVTGPFVDLYGYDRNLGWVPRSYVRTVRWGVPVTTGGDGIRLNGRAATGSDARTTTILALGDSFTFGDEVGDTDAWPAHLERLLEDRARGEPVRVLNAGVSSYGLDQVVLRAEALVPKHSPRVVIVSFIQEDVERMLQRARHGVPKPYFVLTPSGLALRNVPTPPPRTPDRARQWLLRRSSLAKLVAQRGPDAVSYLLGAGTMVDHARVGGASSAVAIANGVMQRLAALQAASGFALIVVAHPVETNETVSPATHQVLSALARWSAGRVSIVNAIDTLRTHAADDPPLAESIFHGHWQQHMSPAGNRYMAELLLPFVVASLGAAG